MLNIRLIQAPGGIILKNSALNAAAQMMTAPSAGDYSIFTRTGAYNKDLKKYIEAKLAGFNIDVQVITQSPFQITNVPLNQFYIVYSILPDPYDSSNRLTIYTNRIRAIQRSQYASALHTTGRLALIFTNEGVNVEATTMNFIGKILKLPTTNVGFMSRTTLSNPRWASSSVQTLTNKLTFSTKPLPFSNKNQQLYDKAWVMKLKRPTKLNFTSDSSDDFDGVVYRENSLNKQNIIGARKTGFDELNGDDMDGIALFLEAGKYSVNARATPTYGNGTSMNMLLPIIYPYLSETISYKNGTNYPIGSKCSQVQDNSGLTGFLGDSGFVSSAPVCGPVTFMLDASDELEQYNFTLKKNGFVTFLVRNKKIVSQADSSLRASYFGTYEIRLNGESIYSYNSSKFGTGKKDYIYNYPKPLSFVFWNKLGIYDSEDEFQKFEGKTLYDHIQLAKGSVPNDALAEHFTSEGYHFLYNVINGEIDPFLPYVTEINTALPASPLTAKTFTTVTNGALTELRMIIRETPLTTETKEGEYNLFVNDGGIAVKKEFFVYSVSTSVPTPVTTPTATPTTLE